MLLGGSDVGQNTLIRFYTLHIAMVPLIMIVMHLGAPVARAQRWRPRRERCEERKAILTAGDAEIARTQENLAFSAPSAVKC